MTSAKPNARSGTIDNDPEFLKFIDELNNPAVVEEKEEKYEQPESTPLLDALREDFAKKATLPNKKKDSRRKNKRSTKKQPPRNNEKMVQGHKTNKNEKKKPAKQWVKTE